MTTPTHELFKVLPKVDQEAIQDEGYCPDAVMEVALTHIENLEMQLNEALTKYRGMTKAHEILEELRPHWAQGYSDDSIAAQVMLDAKLALWKLLKVDSQTLAMQKLPELIKEHARMFSVLTKFGKVVTAIKDKAYDTSHEAAMFAERDDLTNVLYTILMEET